MGVYWEESIDWSEKIDCGVSCEAICGEVMPLQHL